MLRLLFVWLILVAFAPSAKTQDLLFAEDFNTCSLSEQWTVSNAGNQNAVWYVGLPNNPKSDSSTIDGSCMLVIDDDKTGDKTPAFKLRFISKTFSGANYSDLLLKAQVHFRRYANETFSILVDNGKKEYLIREFKDRNYSGSKFSEFVNVNADLSFIASDSMRLILEYDDMGVFGWWAAIDNISITGSGIGGDILLGESFNQCALPPDWSTEILSGVDNWKTGLFTDGKSIDGSCFIYFNDDALGKEAPRSKIRLYSPEFVADEFASYKLTYDLIFRIYEPSEYLQLYVDNGSTWKPVKTYSADFGGPQVNEALKDTIDLSEYRDKKIRLIWEYNDGGWAWWVGMDNIKVIGIGSINDQCSKAIDLVADGKCLTFDNGPALNKDEFNSGAEGLGYIYYQYTAGESGPCRVQTHSNFNDRIEIFTGGCESAVLASAINSDEYGFQGETSYFTAVAGTSYLIRLSGQKSEFGLEKGTGCIALDVNSPAPAAPPTDLCQTAKPLFAGQPCTATFNLRADMNGPLPAKNNRSRADVWYSFTPETQGNYVFRSQANFADALAVYTGNCDSLTELISNFTGHHIDLENAVAGTTYYIQVTAYFSTLEGSLCGEITKQTDTTVVNYQCISAINLPINDSCTAATNEGAAYSGIRPSCDVYLDADVWFSFAAPASGEVYLRAKVDFECLLSVYAGACTTLEAIYCDKDVHHCNGYIHLKDLVANQIYYLQIGAKSTQLGFGRGAMCIEVLDHKPSWQPLSIDVTQECVSKGAVLFTAFAQGGVGNLQLHGLGLTEAVKGGLTYYIEVKDEEQCVETAMVEAKSCNDFGCTLVSDVQTANVTCYGEKNGTASIQVSGGLEPYGFVWSNGDTEAMLHGLDGGTYSVTVTDGSGCEIIQAVNIHQPSQILTNATITEPLCYGDTTGSIGLFVTGGESPFLYHWIQGDSTAHVSHLGEGDYSVTLTDASGCSIEQLFSLAAPDPIQAEASIVQNLCPDETNGSITIDVKGGTVPFDYHWSNLSIEAELENLEAGQYNLSITDANGCLFISVYEVSSPPSFDLHIDSLQLTITDQSYAYIGTQMNGGTPPYQYKWFLNGMALADSLGDILIPIPGIYHAIIFDANDCVYQSEEWTVDKMSGIEVVTNDNTVHVFPNPVQDFVIIRSEKQRILNSIQLFTIQGMSVQTNIHDIHPGLYKIDMHNLAPGSYIIKWNCEDKFYKAVLVK
ncbi:MAG: hypothetical protein IPN29_05845 [Saprospiraceae bacterium]|nr:hypothetical protein [Saprospiraceae bacterium]